jgi:ribonuclease Z
MTKLGITLSSRAMYSSWCYHQPTDTLFDAGEGVGLNLLARIFGIRRICLSHSDTDHVAALFTLIGLRAKTKGDTHKSLDIFYPADDRRFVDIRAYIETAWPKLPYKLTWYPVDPGFQIQLGASHRLVAFYMKHRASTTLGWKVIETRSRLKPEFRGQDIRALIQGGAIKDDLMEVYYQNAFAYCLDAFQLDPADIAGADLAIMDSTFIKAEDRNDNTHMTMEEGLILCRDAGVKHMIAAHLSTRYCDRQIDEAAEALRQRYALPTFQVCHPSTLLEL